MSERAPALEASGLRKAYGSLLAIHDVSLRIEPGEFVGLLGPNGAGKSTLFQIVSGLFAPDAGEVRLFGMSYRDASSAILRRIGVVFQSRSLDLDMSVRANLRFHGGLFGLAGRPLRDRMAELARQFAFEDQLRRPVRSLSGGQQRRVEIARALLNAPEFLLMDEPSAGLDAAARYALVDHMHRIVKEQSVAVLWATHLVEEVEDADRVLIMSRGRIVAQGDPAAVARSAGLPMLTQAYISLTGAKS